MDIGLWAGLVGAAWLVGWYLCWRVPELPERGDDEPTVAVIIPARNEAATLPTLLEGLAHEEYPRVDVVVVDDSSSDDTAGVGARAGARVVSAKRVPAGWTGKTWACATGARETTADVLVFLDADTQPGPGLVARLVRAVDARGGLVSAAPYHRMRRPYERLSAFFHLLSVMGTGMASARRSAPVTGAYGPCLATRRVDYDRAGGHAAVRSSVIEDVALAQRFRASGLGVWVAAGRDAISYRLYPNGLRELAAGWTRSFASGARTTPPARFVAVFAYVAGVGTAAQVPFRAIVAALAGDALPAALAWAAYGAFAVQLAVQLRPLGNYSWAAPLFPIPLVAWFVIFARSIGALALGRVRWKGRRVPVGRRAAT